MIKMSVRPELTPLEKWILWHLYIDGPENYMKPSERRLMGDRMYSVTPEFLIEIIPIPLLADINDVGDVREVLVGLVKKEYVNKSSPFFYSITTQGVLIFRKYVVAEITNLVRDVDRTQAVISKLEKNETEESSKVAKVLSEVAEKVKDKAEEDAADIIWNSIKTIGSIALGYLLRAITSG